MENFANFGVGGLLVLFIIRELFTYLKYKKNGGNYCATKDDVREVLSEHLSQTLQEIRDGVYKLVTLEESRQRHM